MPFVRSSYAKFCYSTLLPLSTEQLGIQTLISDSSNVCDISLTNDCYLTQVSLSQLAWVLWLRSDHIYVIRTLPNTNLAWTIIMHVPAGEYLLFFTSHSNLFCSLSHIVTFIAALKTDYRCNVLHVLQSLRHPNIHLNKRRLYILRQKVTAPPTIMRSHDTRWHPLSPNNSLNT